MIELYFVCKGIKAAILEIKSAADVIVGRSLIGRSVSWLVKVFDRTTNYFSGLLARNVRNAVGMFRKGSHSWCL